MWNDKIKGITISGFADEIDNSLERQIQVIKQYGVSYIEMRGVNGKNLTEYSLDEVVEIKRVLDRENIKISSVGSPIGKQPITEDFEDHFKLYQKTAAIARILEAPYIRMFSFYIPEGEAPEAYREQVFERLKRLIDYAKKEDVILLHENEKKIYGDTAARCREIMEQFACEHFKAVFDFANFVQCGENTLEGYELLKPYIAYIHIKDARAADKVVVPAGQGDGQMETILTDLIKNGYQGFLSLEPHLAKFDGFSGLEQGAEGDRMKMQRAEAYITAYKALEHMLNNISSVI